MERRREERALRKADSRTMLSSAAAPTETDPWARVATGCTWRRVRAATSILAARKASVERDLRASAGTDTGTCSRQVHGPWAGGGGRRMLLIWSEGGCHTGEEGGCC